MRELTIGKNDAGQRLDRFVAKSLPLLPPTLLQKYIRLKRIKVNGRGAKRDTRLESGDILQLYINDEFFDKPSEENIFLTVFRPQLDIVYEDENLLLVNKRPGLVVHADETEKVNTLINHIQAYLYQKKEWNPKWENAFAPALCNRIDRNTGGIVIAAKNAETLRIINEKIKNHEVEKSYLCITVGRPKPVEGKIAGFLLKDEAKKQVAFYRRPIPGGKTAVTLYRTLETRGPLSLVECRLLTGRTHQIRVSPAGGRQVRPGGCEPPLRRDPAGPVFLPAGLPFPHGRRGAELPAGQGLHRGGCALPGQVFSRAGSSLKNSRKTPAKSLILLDFSPHIGYSLLLLNFDEKGSPSTEKRGVSL